MPTELETPPMSFEVQYLFQLFWDIYRRDGMLWSEIDAYERIYGFSIPGDEIRIIRNLASEVTAWLTEKDKPKSTPKKGKK